MLGLVSRRQKLERPRLVGPRPTPSAFPPYLVRHLTCFHHRAEDAKTDVIFNIGSILFPISESASPAVTWSAH